MEPFRINAPSNHCPTGPIKFTDGEAGFFLRQDDSKHLIGLLTRLITTLEQNVRHLPVEISAQLPPIRVWTARLREAVPQSTTPLWEQILDSVWQVTVTRTGNYDGKLQIWPYPRSTEAPIMTRTVSIASSSILMKSDIVNWQKIAMEFVDHEKEQKERGGGEPPARDLAI